MITLDAVSASSVFTGSTSVQTWSHVVGSFNNRLLVVGVMGNDPSSDRFVTGVTYNGDAMTKLVEKDSNYNVTLWYLIAPDTGTHDIVVTHQGGVNSGGAFGASFYECLQNDFVIGSGNSNGSGHPTVAVSTTIPLSLIVGAFYSNLNSNLTVDPSQTVIGQSSVNGGSDRVAMSFKVPQGTGSITIDYTGSDTYVGAAGAFKPIPTGGAVWGFLI